MLGVQERGGGGGCACFSQKQTQGNVHARVPPPSALPRAWSVTSHLRHKRMTISWSVTKSQVRSVFIQFRGHVWDCSTENIGHVGQKGSSRVGRDTSEKGVDTQAACVLPTCLTGQWPLPSCGQLIAGPLSLESCPWPTGTPAGSPGQCLLQECPGRGWARAEVRLRLVPSRGHDLPASPPAPPAPHPPHSPLQAPNPSLSPATREPE